MPPGRRRLCAVLALSLSTPSGLPAQTAVRAQPLGPTADASPRGPFAVGTTTVEVTGVAWIESWNKNLTTDRLLGGRVVVGQDWKPDWQAIAELEIHRAALQERPDPLLAGLSGLIRRRVGSLGTLDAFIETGLGAAIASRPVPSGGTEVNFLLQVGGGISSRLSPTTSLIVGTRLWHLSNGGIIRNDRHNPDIEGLGGYAGLQVHFR
ncbi:MAG: acyloxyacyl hydrolase [Vicinamibacterales bacterium]